MPAVLRQRHVACSIDGKPVQAVDLTVETESIDVSTMSDFRPDPTWEHVDAAGHFHAYAADGKTPTLQETSEEYWCEDCHEHHTSYKTACVICGEEIRPATIDTGAFSKSIPGRTTWTLKVIGSVGRPGERVSVRVQEEGRDSFGIMYAGPTRWPLGPEPATTELMGFLTLRLTAERKS